jgi:hypothetical protein
MGRDIGVDRRVNDIDRSVLNSGRSPITKEIPDDDCFLGCEAV